MNPEYGVGDVAKELGKKWSDADITVKQKYEAMAEKDKARYERVCYIFIKSVILIKISRHLLFINGIILLFNRK